MWSGEPPSVVQDSDVDSRSSSSSPTRGSSWALCSRISTSGRGELLKIAIESLLIAGDLKVSGARPRVTERSTSTAAGASSTIHAEVQLCSAVSSTLDQVFIVSSASATLCVGL